MKLLHFIKMHGIGNDYIYINVIRQTIPNPSALAKKICHRRYGIGGDGIVLIAKSDCADVRMIMYNADGSESENCGNALRCVARYVHDEGISPNNPLYVETLSGIYSLHITPERITLDLGEPSVSASDVSDFFDANPMIDRWFDFGDVTLKGTLVSVGNPHFVTYTDNAATVPIDTLGPTIENHDMFSNRVNIEFVQIIDRQEVIQRTWERGSGETWACGTGAAAVCVAGVLGGKTDSRLLIRLTGGNLDLEWRGSGHSVLKTGPAVEVFRGTFHI